MELLKEYHLRAGLHLEEEGSIVCLMRGSEVLARWCANAVPPQVILEEADKYRDEG